MQHFSVNYVILHYVQSKHILIEACKIAKFHISDKKYLGNSILSPHVNYKKKLSLYAYISEITIQYM